MVSIVPAALPAQTSSQSVWFQYACCKPGYPSTSAHAKPCPVMASPGVASPWSPVGVQRMKPMAPVQAQVVSPPVRVLLSGVKVRGAKAPGEASRASLSLYWM